MPQTIPLAVDLPPCFLPRFAVDVEARSGGVTRYEFATQQGAEAFARVMRLSAAAATVRPLVHAS